MDASTVAALRELLGREDVIEFVGDEFTRFLREEGARFRGWDFAEGLASRLPELADDDDSLRDAHVPVPDVDLSASFAAGGSPDRCVR